MLSLLLALIPLRTFLNETHTFEVARLFRSLDTPTGAGPATTFVISALVFLAGAIVAFQRLRTGRGWRATGAGLGAILLLAAGAISTAFAGQKHFALIGVIDFLAMIVYFMTLRQLLTQSWHVRLALLVVVATGGVVVAKCAVQRWIEIPDLLEYFEEHRAELTPGRTDGGSTRQTGMEHDFEMRLRSAALTAYYPHPNLIASQIILFVMATIGLVVHRFRSAVPKSTTVLPIVICTGLLFSLVGTQSKGAVAACGIALIVWLAFSLLGRLRIGRARGAIVGGWLLAFAAIAGVVIALNAKPDLLGRSILFRHMYWQGGMEIVRNHPLTGVGANNFGRHFTRYKSVECPEEVDSPHSWQMQLLAEWGPIGLMGFLAVAFGVSRRLIATDRRGLTVPDAPPDSRPPVLHSTVFWTCAVGAIVFAAWQIVLVNADPGYKILQMGLAAIAWFAGMLVIAMEDWRDPSISDAPLANLAPILGAGLVGLLIHTSIDLALFAGGPATTFFAVAAIALAARSLHVPAEQSESAATAGHSPIAKVRTPALSFSILAIGAIAATAILFMLTRPSAAVLSAIRDARVNLKKSPWQPFLISTSGQAYQHAHASYALDATAATELSEQLMTRVATREQSDAVLRLLDEAHRRDPDNGLITNHLSNAYRQRFEITGDRADFDRAIAYSKDWVSDYPTSADRRVNLANFLEDYGEKFNDDGARREALTELETALELESRRIYVSQPNRMRPEDRAHIEQRIQRLQNVLR